jgi:prolyl 4-hydroxylase
MFIRDINELIPVYTEFGFTKATLPLSLFSEVQEFYHSNQDSLKEETVAGDFIVNTTKLKTNGSSLIDLSPELRATIHDNLKALLENWCGKTLLPTYVYGIRIYHRGAALKCHRDRLATHIIGVIINVDQEVDEDWILVIDDHQYRRHQITLKPGEMIFYESGRLIHGRPSPLNGNLFANIFCHFKPTDYLPRAVTQQT